MRILGIGDYHSLGDMYWRMQRAGAEVRVHVDQEEAHGIFRNMVPRVDRWEDQLGWVREAGEDGIIVFETASRGVLQDALRRDGFHVFGGCAWGDRIENDRAFGQQAMRDAGLKTARTFEFSDIDRALEFLQFHPARYVYKLSDCRAPSTLNYVSQMRDGSDLRAVLMREKSRFQHDDSTRFILMEFVEGVEVGIGAFFDGTRFLAPALLDFEYKRFFNGDLGELTGEMGTVVTYRRSAPLFAATLAKLAEPLRQAGYCGYINLNTIVNDDGIWPLEFTCRFGYPGFAICDPLHADGWGTILKAVVNRSELPLNTHEGYAVGVVLTVPPFPYELGYSSLSKNLPIFFRAELAPCEWANVHFGEVALEDGQFVTSGSVGYVMVATGADPDLQRARDAAYTLTRKIVVPNLRYRTDIGDRVLNHDLGVLQSLGHLG